MEIIQETKGYTISDIFADETDSGVYSEDYSDDAVDSELKEILGEDNAELIQSEVMDEVGMFPKTDRTPVEIDDEQLVDPLLVDNTFSVTQSDESKKQNVQQSLPVVSPPSMPPSNSMVSPPPPPPPPMPDFLPIPKPSVTVPNHSVMKELGASISSLGETVTSRASPFSPDALLAAKSRLKKRHNKTKKKHNKTT